MNIIYGLIDPRTALTRYIGKSSTGMKRPRNHMLASKLRRDRSHKANWIRELLAAGMVYGIVVIERVNSANDLDEAERRWIAYGRAQEWPLTNLTEGGDGPSEPRPEAVKEKIRTACRNPEARKKMSDANKGRIRTAVHQEKIAAASRGLIRSNEIRAKMSAARKGRVVSAETRAKLSAGKLGKPRPDLAAWSQSPEGRAHLTKLQEMARGRPRPDLVGRTVTQEQRDAISRAHKGRRFSEETIQRMREGQRRRRERDSI